MGRPAAVLALALALDLSLGEYPSALHPVVWMGRCISFLEARAPRAGRYIGKLVNGRAAASSSLVHGPSAYSLRACNWRRGLLAQLAWGTFTALAVPALFAAGAALLLAGARRLGWAGMALEALALKSTFALRELGRAGARVRDALRSGAVDEAREGLRALCSRDPSQLDPPRLAAAAVESLAENASDSVVAPMLWYLLLGLPGAFAYRAANTLDARIGYHGRYEWLGKAAARLDDLWNLLPARLTALLLLVAGSLCGADFRRGARILLRDGGKTESPNAGRPMAAVAGLLGVELEKVGHYRLGDPLEALGADKIAAAWRLVVLAAALALGLFMALLGATNGLG